MALTKSLAAFAAFLVCGVSAQTTAPQYGQCGGTGWTGATTCPANFSCTVSNQWYSQCLPGGAATSTTPPATSTPVTSTPGTGGSTTVASTAPVSSATLASGYSFVRAVEDPNFHKYLQSEVLVPVVDGQLIQNAGGTNLYAVVEPPANSTVVKLGMSWSKTPDTLGTFEFSGDSLEWSSPSVTRQQTNAWLVCPSGTTLLVYLNLGAYGYMTPTGCADETLNAYTGSTAVP
ncbi:carbohydrate-binding module family 1 protein [Mycena polygramma]|nr:carbohydrate-binding module family 1 protein [Mycena polygramma]